MANVQLLTVIVPVFNERATLRSSVERLLKTDLPVSVETLVVDDGSTDGSAETLSDLAESGQDRVLRHERNRAKGAHIRTGLREAAGDVITRQDHDLEYDPADDAALLLAIVA